MYSETLTVKTFQFRGFDTVFEGVSFGEPGGLDEPATALMRHCNTKVLVNAFTQNVHRNDPQVTDTVAIKYGAI